MLYTEVVFDQLYQLMVLETTFSDKGFIYGKILDLHLKKDNNTKILDIYHMKEHLICYKITPESSLNSLWVRSYEKKFGGH